MPRPQFPKINGTMYALEQFDFDLGGVPLLGIKAFNHKEEWEQEGEFANSPVAVGKVLKQYKPDLDIEVVREWWDYAEELLGDGFGAKPFNIRGQWREVGGANLSVFEAKGCTVKSKESSNSGGASIYKIAFSTVIPFLHNGRSIVPPDVWQSIAAANGLGSLFVGGGNLFVGFLG